VARKEAEEMAEKWGQKDKEKTSFLFFCPHFSAISSALLSALSPARRAW
jgi:hypothetical protein